MRVAIVGFDITAWLAAATAVLRGHDVTLVATRATDKRVVAASQHPGQWLLAKTGDSVRVIEDIDHHLIEGDYKISAGVRVDCELIRLKDWLVAASTAQVFALNCLHSLRTCRTQNARDPHFGLTERAILSKSYIRHVSQDDAAAAVVQFVTRSARVVRAQRFVVNEADVWADGHDVEFDLLVLADRAHTTEFGPGVPASVRAGFPVSCVRYDGAYAELEPHNSVFSTEARKIALATSDGHVHQFWTYGDEDRDAVRRDVVDGFCDPDVKIMAEERLFGGYSAAPIWSMPDNMIAIGWQAEGEASSVDDALRRLHLRLGFEYEPLDEVEAEDDEEIIGETDAFDDEDMDDAT